ncbi:uncharacterized protein [Palaemon carinicauda]|uniref:uncharacterized protein n=1 Tax=Palaemon carinicauda TaxID=392227 RepID=UPI0035B6681F
MRIKIWEPKDCLCGFDCKKASILIGRCNVVFGVIHVIHMLYYISFIRVLYSDIKPTCDKFTLTKNLDQDACATGVVTFIVVTALTAAVTVIASIVLLWGVKKKNPYYVLFYLFVKTLTIAFYGMIAVGWLIYLLITVRYWAFVVFFLGSFGIYIDVFYLLNVRLFYRKLKYPDIYREEELQTPCELSVVPTGGAVCNPIANQLPPASFYSSPIALTNGVTPIAVF